jgi:hypothetical protein
MTGSKGASPTSVFSCCDWSGRNGSSSKRNYAQLRAAGSSKIFNWKACTKQFVLGLLAVTSLLVLSARLVLYITFFSSRHAALLSEQSQGSELLIKTEEYAGFNAGGAGRMKVEIESTPQLLMRDRDDDDDVVAGRFTDQVQQQQQLLQGETRTKAALVVGSTSSSPGVAFLDELTLNLTAAADDTEELVDNGPYHSRQVFEANYEEMKRKVKVFVYPHDDNDTYRDIYRAWDKTPSGNYASEAYFKQALMKSSFVTSNAAEADFFFMPVSITRARIDKRVGTEGVKEFCKQHVSAVQREWSFWNRSGGVDHFYLSCHSIARTAMELVPQVRHNAIQLVCPASYHLYYYISHKDASVPQIWPREGATPPGVKHTAQRTRLAFFAGAINSEVRFQLRDEWGDDDEIMVHKGKVPFPYSEALLTSKFCLHVKGYEVNTARLGDAMFYGCVPVVIANYYDLPFADILNWHKFAIVIPTLDIPLLKKTLKAVTPAQYSQMHQYVVQVRKHFQWHSPAREFDAFYMVMYELWIRRHSLRNSLQDL